MAGSTSKGLLVCFICNHCPFVVNIEKELALACKEFQQQGIAVCGICSNDAKAYPADSPEAMKAKAANVGYTFPYLFDGDQSVALDFFASPTPDFFLFDGNKRLVYHGRFCASMPKREKDKSRDYYDATVATTGKDLSEAVRLLLAGKKIPADTQLPSQGCNVKWTAANEPSWFTDKSFFVETKARDPNQ